MNDKETIPYLSEEALSGLKISTNDVVESIESVIHGIENQTAWSAPKAVIITEDDRYMMAALAATDIPPLLAVKTLVLNPRNPDRGLPQINGLVTLLDSESGLPAAILDGNWVTAVRTAGLSAVAAKHLARKDAAIAAFIGCGVQARSHLKAFSDMFPLSGIRVFGRGQANIDRLCREAEKYSLSIEVCGSGKEAVTGADLVISSVTYSTTMTPFLETDWLKPGAFATITDLAAPWNKAGFRALNRIVIDDVVQEETHPNKLAPPECISGDLSGLVLGKVPGRERDSDRTAFIFIFTAR